MSTRASHHAPRPGDQLGDFRILGLLGEGSMGKVYEARQLSLQRRVALKVLPADSDEGGSEHAVTRFYREARAAAQLQHPSIVPVYDFGFEGGSYYYAMQYVPGQSLADIVRAGQTRDMHQIATWIHDLARAVAQAHGQGVIHRDIKPANVLVREDGTAALTDFGLSRVERANSITQDGSLVGTPVYMAPEQARGEKATPSVDIYALGVTLYECLALRVPFMAEGLRELLVKITEEVPTPPSQGRSDVPAGLEAIALKALAKRSEDRYPSAAALAEDLQRFLRGEGVQATSGAARGGLDWRALAIAAPLCLVLGYGLATWRGHAARAAEARAALSAASEVEGWEDYRAARLAYAKARAHRDGALRQRGQREAPGDAALTRAELALSAAEARVRASVGPAWVAVQRALALAAPGSVTEAEARERGAALLSLLVDAAERQGQAGLAQARRAERAELSGESPPARLRLTTKPPGARASLRAVLLGPTLSLGPPEDLGASPLERELSPGHYLLELVQPDCVTIRLPLRVLDPREVELSLELPAAAGLPSDFVYLAPGPLVAGGDPEAVRPIVPRRQELWVPGVFLGEREVTCGEYARFLAALSEGERRRHAPRISGLRAEDLSRADHAEHPVAGVALESARAYCQWRSSQTPGLRFRLPTDLEWEKAARPFPELAYPWGQRFEPQANPPLAWLHQAEPSAQPRTAPGGSHPQDRSLLGLFDLGGNLAEWVEGEFGGDRRFQVLRGGSWLKGPEPTRAASRRPVSEDEFLSVAGEIGFRLAFD